MINPYLQQSQVWADFFLRTNSKDKRHQIHTISSNSFDAYIYQYPLFGNKVFWYIPRAFAVKKCLDEDNSDYISEIKNLLIKIEDKAKLQKTVTHIKIDFNDIPIFAGINPFLSNIGYRYSDRKIQYNKTKLILLNNTENIVFPENNPESINIENLTYFWDNNTELFTSLMDKRTRYGVRKALQYPYEIKYKKNNSLLDDFLLLHFETAKRQQFTTFNSSYFKELIDLEQSGIVNLYDENGEVCATWFGIAVNNIIYHLFGANNLVSRKNYGQYLLHLIILYQMVLFDVDAYDLGGLEEGKGFNLFKKGFIGEEINFAGPYDKIINPFWYNLYIFYRFVNKKIFRR